MTPSAHERDEMRSLFLRAALALNLEFLNLLLKYY